MQQTNKVKQRKEERKRKGQKDEATKKEVQK